MAEKGPPAPTPKPGKTKIPVASQTTKKANISLDPRVVIRPIDYNQGQDILNPPNQPIYLPEHYQIYQIHLLHHIFLQICQINRTCQTNKINQISRIYQSNKINPINKTYQINKTSQINRINRICQTYEINKTQ